MGGSLDLTELEYIYSLYPNYKNFKVFVETGTYKGVTTALMSKFFDRVYTTEIDPMLFEESSTMFSEKGISNIRSYLNDASNTLPEIIGFEKNENIFFFLDAHYSNQDTSWNHKELVPLLTELRVINENLSPTQRCIVCIDDYRFFDQKIKDAYDWYHVETKKVMKSLPRHTINSSLIHNDRFYLFIN